MKSRIRSGASLGASLVLAGAPATAALLAATASPASAFGNTYTVDSLADGAADATHCTTPVPGACTLRDAVAAADLSDLVVFTPGLNGEITLVDGQIEVDSSITIDGAGADVTVNGAGTQRIFRFYSYAPPPYFNPIDATISNLTLNNGFVDENYGDALLGRNASGAGIWASGSVSLRGVTIDGCVATSDDPWVSSEGGGIYAQGSIMIYESTISGNSAIGSSAWRGGGMITRGDATVTRSQVIENSISSPTNTRRSSGAGVYAEHNLTVSISTVSGNSALGDLAVGAGAAAFGNVTMRYATFSDNVSGGEGSAFYLDAGGVDIEIRNSTFSGNQSGGTYGSGTIVLADSPGISNDVLIANSTITANTAVAGGAVHILNDQDVRILQSTIVGNTATGSDQTIAAGGILLSANESNGVRNQPTVLIEGSIVTGNFGGAGTADIGGSFYTIVPGAIPVSISSSLLGEISADNIAVSGSDNLFSSDPGLAPLADNGGSTWTMALLPTSLAIGNGPATVPSFNGSVYDQRGEGYDRVIMGRVDIGAFESEFEPAPTTTTTTTAGDDPVAPEFTG